MATLQKFKFLATRCAVAESPTRSPTASPVIHLRRRKTLRMFLSRSTGTGTGGRRRLPPCDDSTDRRGNSPEKGKELVGVRSKLKDLFVSSPPSEEKAEPESFFPATTPAGSVSAWRRVGRRSLRPLSAALRQRLLRRSAWRPVLVTIPE